jgi:hypothetical protein
MMCSVEMGQGARGPSWTLAGASVSPGNRLREVFLMSRSARSVRGMIVLCVAVLGSLALGAGSAQAHVAHEKISEFSSHGSVPTGVAVNQSTSNVYVANFETSNIFEFNSTGTEVLHGEAPITGADTPSGSFGGHLNIAVDSSTGDLYVPDEVHGVVDKLTSEGVFICELNEGEAACPGAKSPEAFSGPEAVAVDPATGYVYVSDRGHNVIDVFSASGAYINQFAGSGELSISEPRDLKVDSLGDVFVAAKTSQFSNEGHAFGVVEFKPSAEPPSGETTWSSSAFATTENASAIAINPANGVFVANTGSPSIITEYSSAGAMLSTFGAEVPVGYGLAVNDTSGTVYYSNLVGNNVFLYDTFNAATVTTGAVSAVTHTGAKVEGTVNPEGLTINSCFFKYGAQTKPCDLSGAEIGTGNAPVTVSAELTGLEPGTKYPYQLVAEAEGREDKGTEAEFETVPLVTLTSEPATGISPEAATLNGTLTPLQAGEVEYYIEYGTEEPYAKTPIHTHVVEPEEVGTPVKVEEPVTGLAPAVSSTEYHFRLTAVLEGKTFQGELLSFSTPPVATASTEAATNLTGESATLNGKANVLAGSAGYYFEYFQSEGEEPTKTEELQLGLGEHAVSADVTGLEPNRPYHFRIVVTPSNPSTPIQGALEEFTTKVAPPAISNQAAGSLQRHGARLAGEVNPENGETTYHFEYAPAQSYSETGQYSASSAPATIPAGEAGRAPLPAGPVTLSELVAGTLYHYRLTATNAGGTTHGPDATFTTTAPKLPALAGESAQVTSQTTATLSGEINTQGLPGTYAFETGSDTSYGTPTFGRIQGASETPSTVTLALSQLLPGTIYHYRLVATNEDGTVAGGDHVFQTPGFPTTITAPLTPSLIPFTPPNEPTAPGPKSKPKPPTRAQQLAKALKACAKKPKHKRAACIRQAKKKYGPVKKKKR